MNIDNTSKKEYLYGVNSKIENSYKNYELVNYGCIEGKGQGVIYKVMPSVQIIFNEFYASSCFYKRNILQEDWLNLNYCFEGRFECEFPNNRYAFLGEGDFSITALDYCPIASSFPLGVYKGITILLDINKMKETEKEILAAFEIDLDSICTRLQLQSTCHVYRGTDKIKHIFSELYLAKKNEKISYFKLKIFELLYFLYDISLQNKYEECYFTTPMISKVKAIAAELKKSTIGEKKLEDLVRDKDIGLTYFKKCFKEIYGDTPYAYLKKYKMNQAALVLKETDRNINDIAIEFGYKNASKFSDAFKSVFGVVPSKYRKK